MAQHKSHNEDNLTPDSVETLTDLAQILTRLRATTAAAAAGVSLASLNLPGSSSSAIGLNSLNNVANAPVSIAGVTGTTPLPTTSANTTAAGNADAPLTIKEIPAATDRLKHKLQKARVQIRALPDMQRSIAQQEAEMRELEGRIARQKEVLDRLRELGVGFKGQYAETGDENAMVG
jgi:hypothetical protein